MIMSIFFRSILSGEGDNLFPMKVLGLGTLINLILDPIFAKDQATIWATNQLFNGLVCLDKNLNVKHSLSDTFNVSHDGLVYTFIG